MFARRPLLDRVRPVVGVDRTDAADRLKGGRLALPRLRDIRYPRDPQALFELLDAGVGGFPVSPNVELAYAVIADLLIDSAGPGFEPRIYVTSDPEHLPHRHIGLAGVFGANNGQVLIGADARVCSHDESRWQGRVDLQVTWRVSPSRADLGGWADEALEQLYVDTLPQYRDARRFGWQSRPRVLWLGGSRGDGRPESWELTLEAIAAARGFALQIIADPGSQARVVADALTGSPPAGVVVWRTDVGVTSAAAELLAKVPAVEHMHVEGSFGVILPTARELLDTLEEMRFGIQGAEAEYEPEPEAPDSAERLVVAARAVSASRFVIVGGSEVARTTLRDDFPSTLELRRISGTDNVSLSDAQENANWADVIVLWSSTPLNHSVSDNFVTAAGKSKRRPKVIRIVRRGVGALILDLADKLK